MKYLTKQNDRDIDIRTVEDAIYYFASPLEEEDAEYDKYVEEAKEAESLEEFAEIYNKYSDLLFDGAEVFVKEI